LSFYTAAAELRHFGQFRRSQLLCAEIRGRRTATLLAMPWVAVYLVARFQPLFRLPPTKRGLRNGAFDPLPSSVTVRFYSSSRFITSSHKEVLDKFNVGSIRKYRFELFVGSGEYKHNPCRRHKAARSAPRTGNNLLTSIG